MPARRQTSTEALLHAHTREQTHARKHTLSHTETEDVPLHGQVELCEKAELRCERAKWGLARKPPQRPRAIALSPRQALTAPPKRFRQAVAPAKPVHPRDPAEAVMTTWNRSPE
eukprot:14300270-Alexandrium_andersonii.AAC.1